ncbi:efflux RND transporter periplasmic adaptor subunit [Pleomorphovibrio marinus]|uniref:efflux RND transporter periplasmic adaptor subunit n=1 Tax=Pleomorphovibrio marinus TaxID=2164132 RepID=UPI000E0CB6C3|nr:efflux RND transporter periplasmic adaptor subunit [Pleomorphovibrio marinus]
MKKFLYLILLWLGAIGFLLYINFHSIKSDSAFMGVAENDEKIISYGQIVEVLDVPVVVGEKVTKGQKILEVKSPELDLRIRDFTDRLLELQAMEFHRKLEISSQVAQLKAEIKAKETELAYEIRQLETEHSLNNRLTSDLRSLATLEPEYRIAGPKAIRIEALKEDLRLFTDPLKLQVSQLNQHLASHNGTFKVQILNVETELNKLRKEEEKLQLYASQDGIIGFVEAKQGDIIAPHMPVLSVNSNSPSFVNGFIHENSNVEINVGDRIEVSGDWNKGKIVEGKVVGVGSKITEYPERLRKNVDVALWGREVQIKIPGNNLFLHGEKVSLKKIPGS